MQEMIEVARIVNLCEQIKNFVFLKRMDKDDAVSAIGNLADTDKFEPDTMIERLVFRYIDEINLIN